MREESRKIEAASATVQRAWNSAEGRSSQKKVRACFHSGIRAPVIRSRARWTRRESREISAGSGTVERTVERWVETSW